MVEVFATTMKTSKKVETKEDTTVEKENRLLVKTLRTEQSEKEAKLKTLQQLEDGLINKGEVFEYLRAYKNCLDSGLKREEVLPRVVDAVAQLLLKAKQKEKLMGKEQYEDTDVRAILDAESVHMRALLIMKIVRLTREERAEVMRKVEDRAELHTYERAESVNKLVE